MNITSQSTKWYSCLTSCFGEQPTPNQQAPRVFKIHSSNLKIVIPTGGAHLATATEEESFTMARWMQEKDVSIINEESKFSSKTTPKPTSSTATAMRVKRSNPLSKQILPADLDPRPVKTKRCCNIS